MNESNSLNGDLYKDQADHYKMANKQMIRAFVKSCPRELLIEVLKDLKFIQRDWMRKGTKFMEVKK